MGIEFPVSASKSPPTKRQIMWILMILSSLVPLSTTVLPIFLFKATVTIRKHLAEWWVLLFCRGDQNLQRFCQCGGPVQRCLGNFFLRVDGDDVRD